MGKPGRYLIIMTYWWVLPFLVINLLRFPLEGHLASYGPLVIALGFPALLGLISNRLEKRYGCWRRAAFWKKYFLVNGLYALNVGLILAVVLALDYYRLVGFFGGDPEGSFGMLFLPSVIGYLCLGLVLGLARKFFQA